MLIRTVPDLRKHLGGAISASASFERYSAFVPLAEARLRAVIGTEIMDLLDEQSAGNAAALSAANAKLLPFVQKAVAFYTYQEFLPYSVGEDGDLGLQEPGSENTKPIRLGMLEKRIATTADKAAQAIETVLVLLFTKASDYPAWAASAEATAMRRMFVRSGTDLGRALPATNGSFRLFFTLRNYLAEAETAALVPAMGQAQYDALKTKLQNGTTLTAVEKGLVEAAQKAVAHVAYREAFWSLNIVLMPGGGLRILSEFDGINNAKAPEADVLSEQYRQLGSRAERYLTSLQRLLDQHHAELPLYAASPAYVPDRASIRPPDNSQYKTVFRLR